MAGIIDTIKLAGVLVLAIPAALAGLEFVLIREQTVTGAILLGMAAALVLIQHRLTLPTDIPELLIKRVVKTVAKDGNGDSDETR